MQLTVQERSGERETLTVRSMHLPPTIRGEVLDEVLATAGPVDGSLIMGGDINMCLAGPRDEEEADHAQRLLEWADAQGATALPLYGHTHRRGGGGGQIDWITGPSAAHWEWQAQIRWQGGLSDHACVVAARSGATATIGRHCNPTSLAGLPQDAYTDLRSRFRQLGHVFGTHGLGRAEDGGRPARLGDTRETGTTREEQRCMVGVHEALRDEEPDGCITPAQYGPDALDGTRRTHTETRGPAGDMTEAEQDLPDDRAQQDEGPRIPSIPGLAECGRAFLTAMLRDWWRTWRRRRTCAGGGLGRGIAGSSGGHDGR